MAVYDCVLLLTLASVHLFIFRLDAFCSYHRVIKNKTNKNKKTATNTTKKPNECINKTNEW